MTGLGADETEPHESFYDFAARVAEALGPGWTAGRSRQGLRRTVLHGPGGSA